MGHHGSVYPQSSDIALKDLSRSPSVSGVPYADDGEPLDIDNAHTQLLRSSSSSPLKLTAKPFMPYHAPQSTKASTRSKILCTLSLIFLCLAIIVLGKAASISEKEIARYCYKPRPEVPEYFRHTKTAYRGPMETGRAPLLAEEDEVIGKAGRTGALQLDVKVEGKGSEGEDRSIWTMMGHLSPWYRDESGFGVDEYPLPPSANIAQAHVLHRHGARYPTNYSPVVALGRNISAVIAQTHADFTSNLSFLNTWTYALGAEILIPFGRQQLFQSGVAHYYSYGRLYNTTTNLVARTTTEDRMVSSAENFLAGFFGLEWTRNATLETIIESSGFNNSLAGYDNCPNSNRSELRYGDAASRKWQDIYLINATKRLQEMSSPSFTWTAEKAFAAQQLCPYETVAFGYSHFCSLFTHAEWVGFEYATDLDFAGNAMFGSPMGRAVGIGYAQELLARLNQHLITEPTAQDNVTLDNNTVTFPLNQTLYFDFSHDTNIAAVLTALGLTQFATPLPSEGPPDPDRALKVSKLTPFAGRLAIEIITTPHPVKSSRSRLPSEGDYESEGGQTRYIHFLLNSRTLPLGKSWPECGNREDGWCGLGTFLDVQGEELERARFEESCFGEFKAAGYGDVIDGVPTT